MKSLFAGLALMAITATAHAAIPFADGESVTFKNSQSFKLHALVFKAENPKAVLVAIHGMQSHSGWFLSGPELAERGITTLAYDRRGSGLSEGQRGHAYTSEDFLDDLAAAVREAKLLAPGLPIHLHANCFGVRIAIPYVVHKDVSSEIRSVIFTAPGVAMAKKADYSFSERLCIPFIDNGIASGNCAQLSPRPFYVRSPLEDELFVSSGPWLTDFVNSDEYALRELTAGFLMATNKLTAQMNADIAPQGGHQGSAFKTPMLMILGSSDVMVNNAKIDQLLYNVHPGQKQRLVLPCQHGLEFCGESGVQQYRDAMVNWILSH